MPSELYVQVPLSYGDFAWGAPPGSPLLALGDYGREAHVLLSLHFSLVTYAIRWRTKGFICDAVLYRCAYPSTKRTAKRDAGRLVKVGFIEAAEGGYYIPAAEEWLPVRVGTRDGIPDHLRFRVYERDGWRCLECGSEDNLTLDHIKPWIRNGPDTEDNLRTLCGPCNSRKGARV